MRKEKIRQTDFRANELPSTRIKLFFDLLKNRFTTFLSTSMLLILFALPLGSLLIVFLMLISGAIQKSGSANELFSLIVYFSILLVPAIIIVFIGLSGSFEVAKRLAFLQGENVVPEFFYGIKKNWLFSLFMGLIQGVISGGAFLGSLTLLMIGVSIPSYVTGIGIGVLIVIFILTSITSLYFMNQNAVYKNSFFATLKNSFLMATGRIPLNLVFFLMFPCVLIVLLFFGLIPLIVCFVLFAFFNFIFIILWTLRTYTVFDIYINKEHYPELYRKGLYSEEKASKGE